MLFHFFTRKIIARDCTIIPRNLTWVAGALIVIHHAFKLEYSLQVSTEKNFSCFRMHWVVGCGACREMLQVYQFPCQSNLANTVFGISVRR